MKLDFAFVCDYAEAAVKINALGIGFDTIYAPQLPARHPHFSLVVQLRASVAEAGQKDIEVHLIDEDGKKVVPAIKGQFGLPAAKGATESTGRFVVEFGNVEFPRYGSYSVHVIVQGMEMVALPFRVAMPPSGPK